MTAVIERLEVPFNGFSLLFYMQYCAITFLQRSCMQTLPCSRVFLVTCLAIKQTLLLPSTTNASFATTG